MSGFAQRPNTITIGTGANDSPIKNLTMSCGGNETTPYYEDFNSSPFMPNGWEVFTGPVSDAFNGISLSDYYGDYGWELIHSIVFGNFHPRVYFESQQYNWLISPAINLNGLENPALTFELALTNEYNSNYHYPTTYSDRFLVLISTDEGVTWSADNVIEWNNSGTGDYLLNQIPSTGDEVSIPLEQFAGQTIRIAFYVEHEATSWSGNQLHIDNVSIDNSSCPRPKFLYVDNITAYTADLSWEADATNWQICINNDESNLIDVDTPFYTITGLDATTVKVRAVCDSFGTSAWSTPRSNTISSFPLIETFDGEYETIPIGWTQYKGLLNSVLNGTGQLVPYNPYEDSGVEGPPGWNYGGEMYCEGHHPYVENSGYWTVTPFVWIEDNVELSFEMWGLSYDQNNDYNKFVVLINSNDTWSILRQWDNASSEYDHPVMVNIDLSNYVGQNIAIAFYFESPTDYGTVSIDNVSIDYIPECPKSWDLTVNNTTAHTANLSWESDATNWQICINNDETNLIDVDTTSYTVTGLNASTTYTVKVRTVCDSTNTNTWSFPKNFSTQIACPRPAVTATAKPTGSSALLNWGGQATEWVIAYKVSGEEEFTEISVSEKPYLLTGLEPSTSYIVKVKAVCGGIDGESEWSVVSFTTTDCGSITSLPYFEDFESYTTSTTPSTGIASACWELVQEDVPMTDANRPQLYYKSSFAHSGNYSLKLQNRGIYAMPELAVKENPNDPDEYVYIHIVKKLKLGMYLRQPNAAYQLEVGVWEDDSTFVPVARFNNPTTDVEYVECDFSEYTGNGRRIAFRNVLTDGAHYNYSYNYIDDISLTPTGFLWDDDDWFKCVNGTILLPYSENFENYTSNTTPSTGIEPDCWELVREDAPMSYASRPQLYCKSAFAHSGDYSLKLQNRGIYAMPYLSISATPINQVKLEMYLRQPKAAYQLEVGLWNGREFVPVKRFNNSTTGVEHVECDFSNYTGNGRCIAFRNVLGNGANYNYSYNYIDDITLSEIPLTPAAMPYYTDFSATSDRMWRLNNGLSSCFWSMDYCWYTDDDPSALWVSDDWYYLPEDTPYTDSIAIAEKPFYMPATDSVHVEFDVRVEGRANSYLKVFLTSTDETFETTPNTQSNENYSTNALDFSYYKPLTSGNADYPYILNLTNDNFLHISANMPNPDPNGTGKIVFLSKHYSRAIITNFSIEAGDALPPTITTTGISSLTTNSADCNSEVTGSGGAIVTGRGVCWSTTHNPTLEDAHTVDSSGTGTFFSQLTGLSQGTTYYVRAYATNLAGTGYSEEICFTTDCEVLTLPYSENFDGFTESTTAATDVEPTCWELVRTDAPSMPNDKRPQLYYKSDFAHSGDYSLLLNYRGVYAMPELSEETDVPINRVKLDMYLRQPNAAYRLEVGVWDDATNTFTRVALFNNTTTGVEPVTCDFSGYTGNGKRIAFRNVLKSGVNYAYSYNYIDDITLTRITNNKNAEVTTTDNGMLAADRDLVDVIVYPNPTKDVVNVECTMNNVQLEGIEVIDVYGKVVRNVVETMCTSSLQTRINVSGLAAGMYFVRVTTDKGAVTKPFVKK